jgi:hypothetical protein
MANQSKSTSRSIFLDTTSAQSAVENLAKKVQKLDQTLADTNLSQKKRDDLSKQRADAEIKRLNIVDQINKGLGATYNQQQRYLNDLNREIKNIAVGTEEWKKKSMELQQANKVFDEMKVKLNGVNQAQDKAGGMFSSIVKGLGAMAVASFSIQKITGFFSDAVEEAEQAEKSISRLKNTLSNLGREDAFDRLTESAQALAEQFGYLDNDDVLEVFQQLITYGKLTENQIKDVTPVIIDFAAKSGISVNESASVIIKALEGNSKALKEYGINIKDGSNVTERMSILMQQLKPRVDGAAKAFGETMAGQAATANQKLKDVKETIGNQLTPALTKFYELCSSAMTVFSKSIQFVKGVFSEGLSTTIDKMNGTEEKRLQQVNDGAKAMVDGLDTEEKKKAGLVKLNKQMYDALQQYEAAKRKGDKDEAQRWLTTLQTRQKAAEMLRAKKPEHSADDILGAGGDMGDEDKLKAEEEKRKKALEDAKKDIEKLRDDIAKDINKGTNDEMTAKFNEIDKLATDRIKEAKEKAIKAGMSKAELQALIDQIIAARDASIEGMVKASGSAASLPIHLELEESQAGTIGTRIIDTAKDKILNPEAKKALEDSLAKATEQLGTSTAKFSIEALQLQIMKSSGKAKLESQKAQLELEKAQEIEAKKATGAEKEIIEQQYRDKQAKLEADFRKDQFAKVSEGLNYLSQAIDIVGKFNDARNAKENAQFDKEKKQNDARRADIKKLADRKVITETEATKRLAALDAEEDKKKEALEKKQAERNKRMAIAQAIVNGALAVTKILAETPKADFGIATAIQIGLAIATTAAQVATIASQKFAGGGKVLRDGKISAKQNIPTQSNGDNVLATVRTGEVILNERQQRMLGGERTFAAIGVPGFAGGGRVLPAYLTRPYQAINYGYVQRSLVRGYADGGLVTNQPIGASASTSPTRAGNIDAMEMLQQSQQINTMLLQTLQSIQRNGIEANVSLNKIKKAQLLEDNIRKDGQFV